MGLDLDSPKGSSQLHRLLFCVQRTFLLFGRWFRDPICWLVVGLGSVQGHGRWCEWRGGKLGPPLVTHLHKVPPGRAWAHTELLAQQRSEGTGRQAPLVLVPAQEGSSCQGAKSKLSWGERPQPQEGAHRRGECPTASQGWSGEA